MKIYETTWEDIYYKSSFRILSKHSLTKPKLEKSRQNLVYIYYADFKKIVRIIWTLLLADKRANRQAGGTGNSAFFYTDLLANRGDVEALRAGDWRKVNGSLIYTFGLSIDYTGKHDFCHKQTC
jgi:hypothetical protein